MANKLVMTSTHLSPLPVPKGSETPISSMQLFFTTIDVFTTTPYVGNPLAIVRVPASVRNDLTEDQRQKIAREFNLSETTFLYEPDRNASDGTADFDIFTPMSRMSFAGHPTIGTAFYIASHAEKYSEIKQLRTVAGDIPFDYEEKSGRTSIQVPHSFHIHKARLPHPFPTKKTIASGNETVPLVSIVRGMAFNLVSLADLDALALPKTGLLPVEECYKAEYLDQGSGWDVGFTGTFYYTDLGLDPANENKDVSVRWLRTRSIGSREDPGTGSASCALCCYLAVVAHQAGAGQVQRFHLTQGMEMGRRCDIYVIVRTTEDGSGIETVELSGAAVMVMEGTLVI